MLKVFSIEDVVACSFLTPFFFPSNGIAIRAFADLVNDSNSQVYKHPGDYRLHLLGEFDPVTGKFNVFERSTVLGLGSDYQSKPSLAVVKGG